MVGIGVGGAFMGGLTCRGFVLRCAYSHFNAEKQPHGICLDTEPNRHVIPSSLLQVKSGTIFDNFLITDDPKLAEEVGNETWGKTKVRPLL